jgi:hypothetical protein
MGAVTFLGVRIRMDRSTGMLRPEPAADLPGGAHLTDYGPVGCVGRSRGIPGLYGHTL